MVQEIKSLEELKDLQFNTVVYFTRDILDLNKEFYDVGLLIENNLPKRIEYAIQKEFLRTIQETYHCLKDEIKSRGSMYAYNWNIEPTYDPLIEDNIPKGMKLIVSRAPVPNSDLAQRFAESVEQRLKQ